MSGKPAFYEVSYDEFSSPIRSLFTNFEQAVVSAADAAQSLFPKADLYWEFSDDMVTLHHSADNGYLASIRPLKST